MLLILYEWEAFVFDYMLNLPMFNKIFTNYPYGGKHLFSAILAIASKNSI